MINILFLQEYIFIVSSKLFITLFIKNVESAELSRICTKICNRMHYFTFKFNTIRIVYRREYCIKAYKNSSFNNVLYNIANLIDKNPYLFNIHYKTSR